MEQNIESRNKPVCIWSTDFQQRSQEYTMGRAWSLQQVVLGKLDSHMQKNETGPLFYAI